MPVKVSVVIPTYKSAQWVEATLESVIGQTYPADLIEIIVVDDKSPDDSVGVASRMLEKHAPGRSRVVAHQQNRGAVRIATPVETRHRRLDSVPDADDLLAPHKIQLQAEAAARAADDVAVVTSNWQHYEDVDGVWQPRPNQCSVRRRRAARADPQRSQLRLRGADVDPKIIHRKVNGFVEEPNLAKTATSCCASPCLEAASESTFTHSRVLYRQWPNCCGATTS
jgi:hypothetical protein